MVLRGSNALPGGSYYVLASTNLLLPLPSWTRLATNHYDAQGAFAFTNSLTPGLRQRFYLLQLP